MSALLKQDMFNTASDDIRTLDDHDDDDDDDSKPNKNEDDMMFDTMINVHKSTFNDDFMLDTSNESDDENGAEALREAARIFLGEDAQENIDMAISEANNTEVVETTEQWHQSFFRPGSKVS